jgi:DNA (cytosine-5)-methyltransferase 1
MVCADVAEVGLRDLEGSPDLVWASFPCQDLSLAGDIRGLGGPGANNATRSGAFWPFWKLMTGLAATGRGPAVIVLENVPGILTSNKGKDFVAIAEVLADGGYRFGALVVDARWFLPQSRPRVFVIAVASDEPLPEGLTGGAPDERWSPPALLAARQRLPQNARRQWLWWRLPPPAGSPPSMAELLEPTPSDVRWRSPAETERLLAMMSSVNLAKVDEALRRRARTVGTLYRRTRPTPDGRRHVRAEVRFDDVAGCLRTPAGGSSRQQVIVVENGEVRSRLLSAREAARLMGLPDSYKLPGRYNEAYHVAGDGVVVPVVAHLARHIIEPAAMSARRGGSRPGRLNLALTARAL